MHTYKQGPLRYASIGRGADHSPVPFAWRRLGPTKLLNCWGPVLICIHRWKRPRMRRRRLPMSSSDPRRPRGDLRTTNRQDSAGTAALVASSISRNKKINSFAPQYVSHWPLWTVSQPNDSQTAAWSISHFKTRHYSPNSKMGAGRYLHRSQGVP